MGDEPHQTDVSRPVALPADVPPPPGVNAELTIQAFQRLIAERFYPTDAARGTPGTFMWLVEEVGELATSLQECGDGKRPTPEQRHNLQEEFADVFAWLLTLANINGVSLAAACEKYTDPERVKGVKS